MTTTTRFPHGGIELVPMPYDGPAGRRVGCRAIRIAARAILNKKHGRQIPEIIETRAAPHFAGNTPVLALSPHVAEALAFGWGPRTFLATAEETLLYVFRSAEQEATAESLFLQHIDDTRAEVSRHWAVITSTAGWLLAQGKITAREIDQITRGRMQDRSAHFAQVLRG